jgi:uncharacterized membrane protein YcaP (DUF421 family)
MELVIRVSIVFVFLWVVLRALGKRELAQMTPFELVLLVIVGDLIQQGVTQDDTSVTGTILIVSTISMWVLALSYAGYRSKRTNELVEGMPVIVIRDGQLIDAVLRTERVRADEVIEGARNQGIHSVADIRCGVLEPDGRFSFIVADQAEAKRVQRVVTTDQRAAS